MLRSFILILLLTLLIVPAQAQIAEGNQIGLGIIYDPDSPYVSPPRSLEIVGVFRDSPAYDQLHIHDVITQVNGKDVASLTPDEISGLDNVTQPVTLSIVRKGNPLTVNLTPASYLPSADTLVESVYKVGHFKGFESDDYFRSDLNSIDGVRVGDTFAVVDGEKILGIARVNDVSSDYSHLRIARKYNQIDSAYQYRYSLLYVGYYPLTGHHFTEAEMKVLEKNEQKQWKAQAKLAQEREAASRTTGTYYPLHSVPHIDVYTPGWPYSCDPLPVKDRPNYVPPPPRVFMPSARPVMSPIYRSPND